MSLCLNQLDSNLFKECVKACPLEYNPICATNGKQSDVFGNECILNMENCFSNGSKNPLFIHKTINYRLLTLSKKRINDSDYCVLLLHTCYIC